MKIKYKALLIGGSIALALTMLTYLIFNFTYFGYINKHEQQEINKDLDVIEFVINNEKENLRSTIKDWAYWDDTYNFIKDSNPQFIDTNLNDSTLVTLNLKMMVFLDSIGDIIYNKSFLLEDSLSKALTDFIINQDKGTEKVGLLIVRDKTFIIATADITDSNAVQQSNGTLIFVREVDKALLDYIQSVANVTIKFNKYDGDLIGLDENSRLKINHEFVARDRVIKDINGNASIMISIVKELRSFKIIKYYFNTFITYFLMLIAAVIFLISIIADKYILRKLYKLESFMNTVAATKDTALSVELTGRDEFYKLSGSINKMLKELDFAYKEMKEKDSRFRLLMEATNDGYLDFLVNTREVYISPEWKSFVGYTEEDGPKLYNEFISKIHPDCIQSLRPKFNEVIRGETEYFAVEYRVFNKSGDIIWVQQRGKIVEKDEYDKPTRIISTLSNITDRKKYEEEILFLSYSDKLTGLNNRAFMEKQFEYLDSEKNPHYFIIMGDLNGLKFVNDTIGHREGDKLLCAVSRTIIKLCEADDIVSRWGGDEFIILIKNKDLAYAAALTNNIREEVEQISEFNYNISIALGYAENGEDGLGSEFIMSLAEKRMYRNKLMENKSSRNATISSLLRSLHEKNSETEEHTMRIKKLSLRLGKRLELSQDKLDEIELLSLLHDIGKIGISDQILQKATKLTDEEWEIMKSHTEIGFRIAKSTPELSHIADKILSHHERYDGTGYPKGLKGQEIPLISRIISVIDSFDVMTHRRAYKSEMDVAYAVEELRSCSGSQFDPYIVDEFLKLLEEDNELMDQL